MSKLRLIQSEWGGRAFEVAGALMLYGLAHETDTPKSREQLLKLLSDATKSEDLTVFLFGEGFVNQMGKDLAAAIPADSDKLKVIWIKIVPPGNVAGRHMAPDDDQIKWVVLKAIGQSSDLLVNIMAAIDRVLCPRFDPAVFSSDEFFSYDSKNDVEMHLPVDEVREHFLDGTLSEWIEGLVRESDELNA